MILYLGNDSTAISAALYFVKVTLRTFFDINPRFIYLIGEVQSKTSRNYETEASGTVGPCFPVRDTLFYRPHYC